jgi:hypothetical protein
MFHVLCPRAYEVIASNSGDYEWIKSGITSYLIILGYEGKVQRILLWKRQELVHYDHLILRDNSGLATDGKILPPPF